MNGVTPHLVCRGASDAIAFYENVFGATELGRMPAPDGQLMHATLSTGSPSGRIPAERTHGSVVHRSGA